MTSPWDSVRHSDGAAVRRAIREATALWRSGERLEEAVLWMERAAAFAASEGHRERAEELAAHALELDREAKRRSGMPGPTDPAWHEARRIQSSLINVRDSWLEPIEDEAPTDKQLTSGVLTPSRRPHIAAADQDLQQVDASWPSPRLPIGGAVGAGSSGWFDEAPTLPRTVLADRERDTLRPPLGSFNELTLMLEFEPESRPSTVMQMPVSGRGGLTKVGLDRVRRVLAGCVELKAATREVREALLHAGTLLHLGERARFTGWDSAVVVQGAMALREHGRTAHRLDPGASLSGNGAPELVAVRPDTQLIAWAKETMGAVARDCPGVIEAFRRRAYELQTLAAIRLGRIGRYMGEAFIETLLDVSRVVTLKPGAVVVERGMEVHALNITGLGEMELVDENGGIEPVPPGRVLFAEELIGAAPAPRRARAGREGATVLHVEGVELLRFIPHVPLLRRALSDTG